MSIQFHENQLFEPWANDRRDFVADGVVDESSYLESVPRLLFILKEVNDLGGGGWDLREFLRSGGRAQTWNNVTRWIEGIRKLPGDLGWDELANIDEPRRRTALRTIAAVNLKKSPGSHTTDACLLAKYAAHDKHYIERQLALYDANYLICCGTSELLHSIVDFPEPPKWRVTTRGIWYHEPFAGRYVIAFMHPEARCAPYLLHYGLVDAIREIGGATNGGVPSI